MEIILTLEYVKREIDKLIDPQDKLERAIELRAEFDAAEVEFNKNILNTLSGRTISKNSLKVKPFLDSIIENYSKVTAKPQSDDVYTVKSLAKYLDVSTSNIYKLVEKGKIRHSKPTGKVIYFSKADVDEYLAKNKSTTDEDIKREAMNYIISKKSNSSL